MRIWCWGTDTDIECQLRLRSNPPGQPADWAVLAWPNKAAQRNDWEITIPGVLSLLATNTLDGQVKGLHEFAPEDQPPLLPLIFYAFRIMAGIGFALFFLMLWTLWAAIKGWLKVETIAQQKWLLWAWVASIPLGYIAVDMGWTVREVGRQPWIIYGLLRTSDAASALSAGSVGFTTAVYFLIDSMLLVTFVIFAWRIIRKGPDLTLPAPLQEPRKLSPEGHRASAGET